MSETVPSTPVPPDAGLCFGFRGSECLVVEEAAGLRIPTAADLARFGLTPTFQYPIGLLYDEPARRWRSRMISHRPPARRCGGYGRSTPSARQR